jgi:hypothetical protein
VLVFVYWTLTDPDVAALERYEGVADGLYVRVSVPVRGTYV